MHCLTLIAKHQANKCRVSQLCKVQHLLKGSQYTIIYKVKESVRVHMLPLKITYNMII